MTLADSPVLTLRLLRQLKSCGKRFKAADSSGAELSGADLLLRTLALRSFLKRDVLQPDERYVGVFLPPTVAGVATNLALALDGRIAVNLNYTVTDDVLTQCSEVADLKRVITSRKFIEKTGLDPGVEMIFLEDIKDKITIGDKVGAFVKAKFYSADRLHNALGLAGASHDDPLTIIFTSGSTGVPKGVVLTSGNISSNIMGIRERIALDEHDVIIGILPFFHSFGYCVPLWASMCLPCASIFHFSPLEARPIGKLAEKYGATVLLSAPTFLRSYVRRVEKQQFAKLEIVVTGAEKLPPAVADEFEAAFGIRPVEGYGTTELSPVVSVNTPASRSADGSTSGIRAGSVGIPYTDVEARVVDPDSDQTLGLNTAGLLEIRGPNVMQGYHKRPDLTEQVMHEGWYRTGDMAKIDGDGFIFITGRQSRFSKIGGEMVPHIQIEETLAELVGSGEEGELHVAVTSAPDAKRGERIVVLYTEEEHSPADMIQHLTAAGFPNLYLPAESSFLKVDAVPVLGSGKLDLSNMKKLALEHFPPIAEQ